MVPVPPSPSFKALWQRIALTLAVPGVTEAEYEKTLKVAAASDFNLPGSTSGGTKSGNSKWGSSYFGVNLWVIDLFSLALLQDNGTAQQKQLVLGKLQQGAALAMDHLSASIQAHYLLGTREADPTAVAMLQATILDLAGAGVAHKWNALVNRSASTAPMYFPRHGTCDVSKSDGCLSEFAFPASLRGPTDYAWQRLPTSLISGADETAHAYPGIDVMLPYWMGRASGALKSGDALL